MLKIIVFDVFYYLLLCYKHNKNAKVHNINNINNINNSANGKFFKT